MAGGSQSHEEMMGCVHGDVYTANGQLTCRVQAPMHARRPPPIR